MKNINSRAPVKCDKSVTIRAERNKVWKLLTNIDGWPTWQTEISEAKLNGELKPGAGFVWKTGGAKINSTLHTVTEGRELGWTGKTFGIYAIHNWTLTEKNGETTVAVQESMEGFPATGTGMLFCKFMPCRNASALLLKSEKCRKMFLLLHLNHIPANPS